MLEYSEVNYQETLDYLYSFVNYETLPQPRDKAHFDIRRMEELLLRLGEPHKASRTVHIAGTNGKGSVAAMVASALSVSGYKVGLYTSPHLERLEERIRVDNKPIPVDELIRLVERLRPEIEAVNERATYGKLTTFEVLTALGFSYFERQGVDVQVVEVGLGGRLDATNVVRPEVAIITSISFDHREVLGDTLAQIAGEKVGIIKEGCYAVSSPQVSEAMKTIEERCQRLGVSLIKVGEDVTYKDLGFDLNGQSLLVRGRLDSYELTIPLLGYHQLENAATAVASLEVLRERGLKLSRESIIEGLRKVSWPGRLQVIKHHPLVVVDGAHNPKAAFRLKEALKAYFHFRKAYLIMGASLDKDVAGVISELAPLFEEVVLTQAKHPRALPSSELEEKFKPFALKTHLTSSVSEALSLALTLAGEDDLICACGSLFVVAEVMRAANFDFQS